MRKGSYRSHRIVHQSPCVLAEFVDVAFKGRLSGWGGLGLEQKGGNPVSKWRWECGVGLGWSSCVYLSFPLITIDPGLGALKEPRLGQCRGGG